MPVSKDDLLDLAHAIHNITSVIEANLRTIQHMADRLIEEAGRLERDV